MQIGVVGLGLIGGSLGYDLRRSDHQVWGLSRNPATCDRAIALGICDCASDVITKIPDLGSTDLIVICTPIASILPTLGQLVHHLSAHTVVTDVGSVKEVIVASAEQLWSKFVGSHPMAGTALQGIEAAQANLFSDRPCVITPTPQTDPNALALVKTFWQELGTKLLECSPQNHDLAVAGISHLPVFVSASLISACTTEPNLEVLELAQALASSGFKDTSRVGGGNPELGRCMAEFNHAALLLKLDRYQASLEQVISWIRQQDWEQVEDFLTNTQSDRAKFVPLG
ncbi:MAG: prephenate/arogenate dehydrogenase [Pseudanabaenaceae cyanobacterium bins.68]|nr:prephenate/arogenate dehydrogenase [Pseudanabaenaceae cyanobacterium bins.68]